MATKKARQNDLPHKCTWPGCTAAYKLATGLGIHKLRAHGIPGQSKSALDARNYRARKAARLAAANPTTEKRKYTKRSTALVKTAEATPLANHNGNADSSHETAFGVIPQATLALALGRFQELSKSIAFEHDLPPRSFAAQLATLIYATQVRESPRSAMRLSTL